MRCIYDTVAKRRRIVADADEVRGRRTARGCRTMKGRGSAVGGGGRTRGEAGRSGVGEQYLGDFALYLEMSFVGSISSTIRTLSLCPGVSGCWFRPCLSVSANGYTPYMSLSLPFLFRLLFCLFFVSLGRAPTTPRRTSYSPRSTLPLNTSMYLSHQPTMYE